MFPREQPIDQHDLIAAAESQLFEEFDGELDNAGHTETRRDFDFTEVPLPGAPLHGGQSHVVARPRPGVSQKVWVRDGRTQDWWEDAQVDSRGDVVDQQGRKVSQPQPAPQGSPGHCGACGCATMLPNGGTAAFCPSCGTPQMPAHQAQVGVQMGGGQQPAVVPMPPPPPAIPAPVNAGIRMVGNQKPPPVIPEGLGKTTGDDAFAAFLDAAVEAGKDKADEGPDPTQGLDETPQ